MLPKRKGQWIMKKTSIKKIMTAVSAFVITTGYCLGIGAAGYTVANAQENGIASDYFGPYYLNGDRQSSHWLNIPDLESAVFRGYYSGKGIIACANPDPNTTYFAPNDYTIGADNFQFIFYSWARLINDAFEPQTGFVEFIGCVGRDKSSGEWQKKARISLNYYILMRGIY